MKLPAWAQILLTLALVTPIGPLINRIVLQPDCRCLRSAAAHRFGRPALRSRRPGAHFFRRRRLPHRAADQHAAFTIGTYDGNGADRADDRCGVGVQPDALSVLRVHRSGKTLRADRGEPPRRTHRRHQTVDHRHARLSARLAARRDIGHSDRAGDDAVLRFRISHWPQSICRRHLRRHGQLSAHRDRGDHGGHSGKLRLVLEQLVQGSRRFQPVDSDSAVAVC